MDIMQRITYENKKSTDFLLKKHTLVIGYSVIAQSNQGQNVIDLAQNPDTVQEFKEVLSEFGKDNHLDWLKSRQIGAVHNFLSLQEDDRVIVPFPKKFSIFKVTSKPYILKASDVDNADLGFAVKVEPIVEYLSRNDYLNSVMTSKLKNYSASAVLPKNEVTRIIKNSQGKTAIHDFSNTKAAIVDQVTKYISHLNPDEFELLVKYYLDNLGADSTYQPPKNEKHEGNGHIADIDVIAPFTDLGIAIFAQVKHHQDTETRTGLDQLIAYNNINDDAYKTYVPVKWLVTTASLPEDLLIEARQNQIHVIQNTDFAELPVEQGLKISADVFRKRN